MSEIDPEAFCTCGQPFKQHEQEVPNVCRFSALRGRTRCACTGFTLVVSEQAPNEPVAK